MITEAGTTETMERCWNKTTLEMILLTPRYRSRACDYANANLTLHRGQQVPISNLNIKRLARSTTFRDGPQTSKPNIPIS
jgi:hypothetical protein